MTPRSASWRLGACVLVATVALAGCEVPGTEQFRAILGSDQEVTQKFVGCPRALVVDDAKELVSLRSGGRRMKDVRVAARINLPLMTCDVGADRVGVSLTVPIQAVRGPQLAKGEISFVLPYFVAVADARGRILGKRVFTVRITIPAGQKFTSVAESIEQEIPLPAGRSAANVVIYTGFQLTPAQLDFNRRNRLRF